VKNRKKLLIAGGAVLALAFGGTGVALGTGGDDGNGQPITGSALQQAKAAALAETGDGRVSATELRDEEGYYEVEVTRDDRSQVDVHLNRDFKVTDSSADGPGSDGGDGGESR
jgi:Peptidase propeptide and YPEB domain